MFKTKMAGIAITFAVLLMSSPQNSWAEGFTGRDFLNWNKQGQDSYFQTSITMAGVIATQTHRNLASCIDNWYFGDVAVQKKHNAEMLEAMRKHPEFHPSAIILAVLQKACGSFKDGDR